jgi:hypothetical protein
MEAADTGGTRPTVGVVIVAALSVLAGVRLSHSGLGFVPKWLALIVIVFGGLELLSCGWNVLRGKPWNERTIFDLISNALVWLPWPP